MSYFYFPEGVNESAEFPYEVTEIGYHFSQLATSRPNGLREYQFVYCVSGKGIFKHGNEVFEISAGMGFFTAPRTSQEYYAVQHDWIVHYVLFSGFGVEPYIKSMNISNYQIFTFSNPFYIEKYFQSLYDCVKTRKNNWKTESSVILYAILNLFHLISNDEVYSNVELPGEKLLPVLNYIEKNYTNMISLQDLADVIHVSPSYFCQLFKKTYKISPIHYINHFRIQKAKDLLCENHLIPIHKICELVGFSDASYFCRLFRNQEGVTPSEFRENS